MGRTLAAIRSIFSSPQAQRERTVRDIIPSHSCVLSARAQVRDIVPQRTCGKSPRVARGELFTPEMVSKCEVAHIHEVVIVPMRVPVGRRMALNQSEPTFLHPTRF